MYFFRDLFMKKSISKMLSLSVALAISPVYAGEILGKKHVGSYDTALSNLKSITKQLSLNHKSAEASPTRYSQINTNLCDADEHNFNQIQMSLLDDLRSSLKSKNYKKFSKLFTKNALFPKLSNPDVKKVQNFGYIKTQDIAYKIDKMSNREIAKQLKSRFSGISSVEFIDVNTEMYHSPKEWRNNPSREFKKVDLFVNLDLRLLNTKKQKVQITEKLKLTVVKKGNDYLIESYTPLKSDRFIASASSFKNETVSSGIENSVPTYLRTEAIRRGGYALAIDDYDKDGYLDMYVGAAGNSTLIDGSKGNKFKRIENKELGLEDHVLVKSAAFGDFFNTGYKDLLVVTFTPGKENVTNSSDIILYRNTKGKFKRLTGIFDNRFSSRYAMPAAIADFDGDNFLDFYVGFPGAKDFTTLKERVVSNKKYQVQGLYLNNKADGFKDISKKALGKSAFDSKIYPHSAVAVDYDKDGDMDLVVADDRGNVSPVFENIGNNQFQQSNKKIGVINEDFAMGIAVGDLNNDGHNDFAVSSVNFHASARVNKSCEVNWNEAGRHVVGTKGLRVFYGTKSGTYLEMTEQLDVGEGVGGVEFVDYNNDGLLDIYVANGLWSGTSQESKHDLSSIFVTASATEIFEDELNFSGKPFQANGFKDDYGVLKYRDKSQSSIMEILANYKGSLDYKKIGNNKKGHRPSLAGFQKNRLLRNLGDGVFVDVAYLEGVDSLADGYILAYGDFDKSGQLDIVLRNADPGSHDVKFSTLEYFRNDNKEGKSVTVSLESKYSNREAIGARLEATIGKKTLYRTLISNNGTAQSEKILHFGLGKANKVDNLKIYWPSGNVENIKNLSPGHHEISEKPQGLTAN